MDLFDRILELSRQGFFCAQIIMTLGLEADGRENPDLVRAVGGLNGGLGFTQDVCGCLTGGCCLISYFLGKGEAGELEDPKSRDTIAEFVSWFKERTGWEYGGEKCGDITGGDAAKRLERCPGLIGDAFQKCAELLNEKGVM